MASPQMRAPHMHGHFVCGHDVMVYAVGKSIVFALPFVHVTSSPRTGRKTREKNCPKSFALFLQPRMCFEPRLMESALLFFTQSLMFFIKAALHLSSCSHSALDILSWSFSIFTVSEAKPHASASFELLQPYDVASAPIRHLFLHPQSTRPAHHPDFQTL